MSCDYDVWCLDCNDGHGFDDANHMSDTMTDLAKLGPQLAAFAPTMRALKSVRGYVEPNLYLCYERHRIDLEWFEAHGNHRLIARDEYGRNIDECGEHFSYCACKHQQNCRRPRGHDGPHNEKRDDATQSESAAQEKKL